MINKKIFISFSTILLAACGDNSSNTTINPVAPGATDTPKSEILYDPVAGVLALPDDILFVGTTDGTLEPPDEASAKEAGEAVDFANPGAAIGGLDGWSTQMPMQISVDMEGDSTIDATTISAETVLMVETDCGLGGTDCTTFTPASYGVDYVGVTDGSSVTIVPVKPLKAKTNYIVALTDGIQDSRGESLAPSPLYAELTVDPSVLDIENESLAALQDAVNGYEGIVALATGTNPDNMIYTSSWTTISAGDAMGATAQAVTAASAPQVVDIEPHPDFPTTASVGGAGIADVYQGSVTLPYFLAVPTVENPLAPLTEKWTALCDNGVLLSQADPDFLATLTPGPNAVACGMLGLADFGLDTERHVTQYNPVAEVKSLETLDVIITVPNALSGHGSSVWPLVIYQHGITSNKETMLAIADSLALQGFAAIGIDMPLHGSRGFDLDGDDADDLNASVDVTHYMNLGYLLTGRDNLRQSVMDLIGLRMAINNNMFTFAGGAAISDADFDRTEVHFVGLSLGGMNGSVYNAVSTGLGMPSTSATYTVSGGGIIPLLMDSGSFGELIQSSVLEGAGLDPATVDDATAAAVLGEYAFAAQAIIDAGDPNNYAAATTAVSPTLLIQVNGDTVIPNQSSFGGLTFGGTVPLATNLGVDQLFFGDAPASSGYVKFTEGSHGSLLDPSASAAATTEMQTQVVTFLATGNIVLTDAGVVE